MLANFYEASTESQATAIQMPVLESHGSARMRMSGVTSARVDHLLNLSTGGLAKFAPTCVGDSVKESCST